MRVPARMVMVAAGLAGGLLAGCGQVDGIDGDLTGDWRPMPAVQSFAPEAGFCHTEKYRQVGTLAAYEPVDCAEPHETETVYVGEFGGDAGDRVDPPLPGSPEWREVYTVCDEAAAAFLGRDFRHARMWLGVTVPSESGWSGGARWFRCELTRVNPNFVIPEPWQEGSLADALAGDSELVLGCFEVTQSDSGGVERMDRADCTEPHQAEFVGVWSAPNVPFLDSADPDSADRVHRGCRERVAAYVDVPVDGNLIYRTGTIVDWIKRNDWENGDRGFRCYLWLNESEVSRSLADAGTSALPIQYE